jgi:protein ImuB
MVPGPTSDATSKLATSHAPDNAPGARDAAQADGLRSPVTDALAVDAPATRVRTPNRPRRGDIPAHARPIVAPPGATREALAPLPLAALRLAPDTVEGLARLGLRRVGDLVGLPRAGLARRFGIATVRRLDQALGAEPEPVAVAQADPARAVRLSLPEPVGRRDDIAAALDRLLDRLAHHLAEQGHGARRLRLRLRRVDGGTATVPIGLARPSRDPALIARLFARPLEAVEADFGIDALRLEAVETEPLTPRQHRGHLDAARETGRGGGVGMDGGLGTGAGDDARDEGEAFATLLGKLGNRLGFERLERYLPADSHIPTRAFTVASAAFTAPPLAWPTPPRPRPLLLFPPEPAWPQTADGAPLKPPPRRAPPPAFRWRGRTHRVSHATGPERIAPEWWLDDPAWRSGPRDYWRVETGEGLRLWLFFTPQSPDWWVEGQFA